MKKTRRGFQRILPLLFIFPFLIRADQAPDAALWQRALALHRDALVIDTHCDTPMVMIRDPFDIGRRTDRSDVDLVRMREGGVDAMFFAVFVSNRQDDRQPSKVALAMIDEILLQVEKNSGSAALARSSRDIVDLHAAGTSAILIGMENGGPLEGSLRLLRNFYRLGVRYITLTHGSNNDICDSSTDDAPRWNGLSPFGETVVAEMNRLGMMIDVSHISDEAFWDVIEHSRAPVIASHSCARTLCDVPRNLGDDMIRALARQGGVMQINFYSGFLDPVYAEKSRRAEKEMEPEIKKLKEMHKDDQNEYWKALFQLWKQHAPPPPDLDILIDHIDHVVRLVGEDFVGLGSDFDGAGSFPKGLEDVSGFPRITHRLLERGYGDTAIRKILGGNLLRVFREVEDVRDRIAAGDAGVKTRIRPTPEGVR